MKLSNAALADGAPEGVPVPEYDRSSMHTGIVHFGFGNFHRAHQAMYLDHLMRNGGSTEWGICGVGTLPSDVRMRDAMNDQDRLYTLVVKHPDGTFTPRVIGSVNEYLFAPEDGEKVLARLADPNTRIASLTITEGGYNIDRTTGEFVVDAPSIVADVASPHAPKTVFGLIVEGLARRRQAGILPFTVMSCDNLAGNGAVARHAMVAYARLVDPDLADWIDANVHFPNSMVDRITPTTTDADRALVLERFGIDDEWPVMTEPFVQWVLEDSFSLGRPAYDEVGVQVVHDVLPYELLKLRILNAGHQALGYAGFLRGHRYAHEAMADPVVAAFVGGYMRDARQTLPVVPGVDVGAYIDELFVRFGNPAIADTLTRLVTDGADRVSKFVLPAVRDNLAAGRPVSFGAALVALWRACYLNRDEPGLHIELIDSMAQELSEKAASSAGPEEFLLVGDVFGELSDDSAFRAEYRRMAELCDAGGLQAVVEQLTAPTV